MSHFVHLDVRSYFSIKEGAFSPEALVRRAAELGMPSIALTDRDGLYGAARFVAACEREGVRPILGASVTVRESGTLPLPRIGRKPKDGSVVLLARDETGYANLCRLVTDAHMTGERGDPSLTPEQICAHAGGLVALLGPTSQPASLAIAGRVDAGTTALEPYREAFGDRAYVSVQHRLEEDSAREVRALLRLSERAEVRAVATNPVRYLVPQDAFLADALECMRELVPINRTNVSRRNAEGWLKPANEMRALFAERPDLVGATREIAGSCTFELGLHRVHFPSFPTPRGRSASSVLAERCWRGLERRGMRQTAKVRDRLNHELALIHRMGYSAYFLTVADIVSDVRAMGIRCACRGSAAGSLVCYLTEISDVDAVRHDLAFERFLNPMRDELPDIDVDVESARREDVYDMMLSRYGDDRCACVAMIDTYRARAAVREVGKALGLPEPEVDTVAKSFPHIGAGDLRVAIERLPELAGSNMNAGQLEQLFRVAERLDGFPRHIALHPSGIVLSNDDLVTRVPLERSFQGYRVIQADKDDVELLGYLKLDVLGVRMLSSMRHALDEIARTEHVKVDLDQVALDDEPTFELIRASDTLGCFQIESPGQRELLQKLQPTRWEDLIVDISLFRPGPVKSDMINPYLRRRLGMERPTYAHPALRPALRETFGVIVYHEQVLRTLAAMAGYDLTYADHIRRHLDDEDLLPGFRADFLERARARGVPGEVAERTWNAVAEFASFGFCKAHAAAFAVPTYQSAWLKTHYPAHFLSGILTHDPGMYPRRLLLEDAREHDIPILPLDVNASEPEYVVEEVEPGRYGIRLALQDVHGISDAEVRSILQARAERPFHGVGDFLRRCLVSKPVVEALAHAGAFDAIDRGTRRDRLYAVMTTSPQREGDQLTLDLHGTSKESVRRSGRARGDESSRGRRAEGGARSGSGRVGGGERGRGSEATGGSRRSEAPPPSLATDRSSLPEYSDAERVRAELEVLGLDASRHLVSFYEPLLADLGVTRSKDLRRCRSDERVMVAGVKVASQTPAIRSGQRIIFLTLDDATGPVEVVVFESVQPKVAKTVFHSFVLAVVGTVRRTGIKGVSVIAEDVWDLLALHRARRDGRLSEALAHEAVTSGGSAIPRKLWHSSPGSSGR
ncbi:MAG: DNA polymerase III subunit alpha [Actinobacteria bacterium]|nr:DNA polymerase III subunit alpha [Actinomycetota bacterium]